MYPFLVCFTKTSLTVIQDNQQGRQQVTHALDVARIQVLPHVAAKQFVGFSFSRRWRQIY